MCGYSTVFFKWFHWKFYKTRCSKDGKIIQHYLLDAIWQRTLGKLFICNTKSRILEGMLTSCPGLEQLYIFGIIYHL